MKVVFINPNSEFLINDMAFPTLGLLYLSAYLKKNGYVDIKLIELNGGNVLPEFIEADIVGFYSNTSQFLQVRKLVNKVRLINKAKDALYVIGGPHVSGNPQDGLADFDFVVVGEGERALLDIVRLKEQNRRPGNRIVRFEYERDIDSFPYPDRDILDIKSYKYFIKNKLTTPLLTSRGCPFSCCFCANNAWGKTLRMRKPENVFEEVRELKEKYGYESFMFYDDTMTIDKNRMKNICELLKSLGIIYRCLIRSDTVDKDLLRAMRDSGCAEVGIGIESGSQRILDTVRKGEKVKDNFNAIKMSKELGIHVKGFIIVGLPGENKESIRETINFLEAAELDDLDVTVFTPYPGSEVYRNKEKYDINFDDDYGHAWFKGKPGFYKSSVSTSGLSSEEVVQIRDEIEKRFKKESLLR